MGNARKPKPEPMPSLFDMPIEAESREEMERDRAALGHGSTVANTTLSTGPDPAKYQFPRRSGQCIKQLLFWTGRVAVEVGPVEIEHNSGKTMTYIHADGRIAFTFTEFQMDKFREHFSEDAL